eukprot:7468113-Karenia_brevis.AAC.1
MTNPDPLPATDDLDLQITLEAHEQFLRTFSLKDTALTLSVKPTEGAAVPVQKWWNAVFRTRSLAAWKRLLGRDGHVDESTVAEIDSKD